MIMPTPIPPRELPRVRDSIAEFGASGIIDKLYALKVAQLPDHSAEQMMILAGAMKQAANLSDADLYYIGPEMCDLLHIASKSLPEFILAQDDAPCRKGFAWLAKPLVESTELLRVELKEPAVVVGIGWEAVGDTLQLAIHTWRDAITTLPMAGMLRLHFPPVFPLGCWRVPIGEDGLPIPIGMTLGGTDAPSSLAFLKSFWLMLRQPLVRQELATADRAERRRAQRAGYREPPPVRVIQLRRPSSAPPIEAGRIIEWHHQWIVRGHWRNQAYGAGRKLRRPVWIAPFVKGPEGAPMLGGEKVYVLDQKER